jgi:hypothetical protein
MRTIDLSSATWRKSSRNNQAYSCVEVADLDRGHRAVRDSKNPTGPTLLIPSAQWATFTTALCIGDFG